MNTEPYKPTSEDLAAYLDGELSREETLTIESRLASDAELRNELRQLQKAWDLLDVLPRAKADENFSTTTMSLAVADMKREAAKRAKWKNAPRILGITCGILLAAVVGYFAVSSIVQKPVREMERDLHLLTNFDTYSHLSENFLGDKNLEYLKLLQSSGLFVAPESGQPTLQFEPTSLASLSPQARDEVLQHYRTLSNGSWEPSRIDAMRGLATQISADPSRIDLLRTYDRYYLWLQGLQAIEIREIEAPQDPAKRMELVRTRIQRQNRNRFEAILKSENLRVLLTKQDYDVYVNWLGEFISAHEAEFTKVLMSDEAALRRLDKVKDEKQKRFHLYGCYVQKVGEGNAVVPSQADFVILSRRLSEEAKKRFSAIELDEQQRRQLLRALRNAWWRAISSPPPSEEDLAAIRASLTPEEREKLEHMKKSELHRALIERYEKQREPKNRDKKSSEKKNTEKAN